MKIRMKKFLALIMTLLVAFGILAGCGASEEGSNVDDIAEITISYWPLAAVPDDENKAMVEDAINAITEEEIGVHVNLNIMDVGSYIPMGMMATGVANGEDFDLVLTAPALSGHYTAMTQNSMLTDISDLLTEYAPELLDTLPEDYLKATTDGDAVYGVPTYFDKVQNQYWICKKSVADAAGINIEDVKTIDDVTAALEKIKAKFPEMNAIGGSARSLNVTYPGYAMAAGYDYQKYDVLGESTGVLAVVDINDDTYTVQSRYESADFKADAALVSQWYQDDLVNKDVATDTATLQPLNEQPNTASVIYTGQFNLVAAQCTGEEYVSAKIATSTISTSAMRQFVWAVPVSCDEPEAAVKFMNMLYTDERIVNLVNYGVEGTHYVKNDDGTIGFPEGVTAETAKYNMGGLVALIGNGFLAYTWEGGDPNTSQIAKEEMDNARYSPLIGFALDTSTMGDTFAMLSAIANEEYGPGIFSGSAPAGRLDEMINKLKAAGLDEYLAEAQRQVDEFVGQ